MQQCSGDGVSLPRRVIRAYCATTDADVGRCPRRVRQTRAVDVVDKSSAVAEIANVNFFTTTSASTFTQCAPEATEVGDFLK